MRIRLNGEPTELPADSTPSDLVQHLGLRDEQVAVEVNRKLVRREERAVLVLRDGDEVELVTLVGGG